MTGITQAKSTPKYSKLWTWAAIAAGLWTTGFIYNVYIGGYAGWLRTMYNRKVMIAETIEQPKVIIVGGSGAHYTINSDVLADGLGMPVINLGTNGGVGLNVLLPSVIDQVKPGDILLMIPEYPLLISSNGLDDLSATFSLMIGRPGVGGVPPKALAQNTFLLGIPSLSALVRTGQGLIQEGRLDYYGDPLTARGDATIEIPRQSEWWPMRMRQPMTEHTQARLREFRAEVEARGGTLVFSLPWLYGDVEDQRTMENIAAIADGLAEIAPTIYDPETLNVQDSPELFADTHYHLKIPARSLRSQQLVQELQPLLPQLQGVNP